MYLQHVKLIRRRNNRRNSALFVLPILASVLLTGCGSDSESDSTTSVNAPQMSVDLSKACPETVEIQTDWNPQAEHGFVYKLLGPDYNIDTESLSVTGSLHSQGSPTGVRVRINAGGPAINFDPVISRLYSQPNILLAFMSTDIAISKSQEMPTVAVVAPFNINPQILMWDPQTYPDVRTIDDLKTAQVKVIYFRNVAYMRYLVGAGILDEKQVVDSYDGFPEQFITANGAIAQQGFGTNEPFFYENKLAQWMKPVRYQYLHELGWTPYAQSLATTPEKKQLFDECLRLLIPIIQQAQVDYVTDPSATNELIVETVRRFSSGSAYDIEQATASTEKQLADRLVSNSPDNTLGSFDIERINTFIATAKPIYEERGDKVKKDLTASDLVTNEYIDRSISLPADIGK